MKELFSIFLLIFCSYNLKEQQIRSLNNHSEGIINVGSQKQLFIDDYIIESIEGGVFKELNRPVKYPKNPVIEMDRPYEASMRFGNSTNVIYDEEEYLFKMWNEVVTHDWSDQLLAYYVSEDGIRWEKPKVGQFNYHSPHLSGESTQEHNFIFGKSLKTGGFGVIKVSDTEDSEKRYKMLYRKRDTDRSGIWAAYSPDGIHWTDYTSPEVNPVYINNDTHQSVFWDKQRKKYISHMRLWPYAADLGIADSRFESGRQGRLRAVGIATSENFEVWDAAQAVRRVPIEEIKDYLLLAPDEKDAPRTRGFYSMETLQYEGLYIGFISVYHNYPTWEEFPPPTRAYEGKTTSLNIIDNIDIQLAFSRDGRVWNRVGNRETFIPNGVEGSYDGGMIFVSQAPVVRKNLGEIWIYYVGSEKGHWALRYGRNQESSINLAMLRLDGFVSLSAGKGIVITKPLIFEGDELVINANTYGGIGSVTVEVLDALTNESLTGFGKGNCNVFTGDNTKHTVTWKDNTNIGKLEGEAVKLKFCLQSAKLFSFQFKKSK